MASPNKDDVLNFFSADAKTASSQPADGHLKKPTGHQHKDSFDPFSGGQSSGSTDDLSDLMGGSSDAKSNVAAQKDTDADLLFGAVKGKQVKPALAAVTEAPAAKADDAPLAAGSLDSSLFSDLGASSSAAAKKDEVDLI